MYVNPSDVIINIIRLPFESIILVNGETTVSPEIEKAPPPYS